MEVLQKGVVLFVERMHAFMDVFQRFSVGEQQSAWQPHLPEGAASWTLRRHGHGDGGGGGNPRQR